MSISLLVNGVSREVDAAPDQDLLFVLRDVLNLTGTKYGCGEGQCGACTVLLEGKAARSCRTSLRAAQGKAITTIEGLEQDGKLHQVQEAFLKHEAFQCGYCTSGMILSAVALLRENASPTDQEILRFMNGNVCRCGTYSRILAAVQSCASSSRQAR
jgi:aerobic-type carbon monoxide dehydrogenase small subunit (CoxS/CutS family)